MGVKVTAAQAAQLVRHSEKWIRAAIRSGALPAEEDTAEGGRKARPGQGVGPSRWAIDTDDLLKLPGVRINHALLAELKAQVDGSSAGMLARLAELERQVRDLRRQVRELRASQYGQSGATSTQRDDLTALPLSDDLRQPTPSDLALSAFGAISPDMGHGMSTYDTDSLYPPRRAVPTMRLGGALPDGLVPWRPFANLHRVPESTVQKAIDGGRLAIVAGRWKQGRTYVLAALDADGRRQFYALWGDRADFHRCADCPH